MARPNYCPACGGELADDNAVQATRDEATGDGGYDVYCDVCGWSGDIAPDDEAGEPEEPGPSARKHKDWAQMATEHGPYWDE